MKKLEFNKGIKGNFEGDNLTSDFACYYSAVKLLIGVLSVTLDLIKCFFKVQSSPF